MIRKEMPVLKGKIAAILLGPEGMGTLSKITSQMSDVDAYVHSIIDLDHSYSKFERVIDLTREIFSRYSGIIYIMPCGVVSRAIAPMIEHKLKDPAVVVVDVLGRWSISLLSGHEGGANRLADQVGWMVGAEPIVTTTSEAARDLVVGVGCRRGTPKSVVLEAITEAFKEAKCDLGQIRLLASIDLKKDEEGIVDAAAELGAGLRFLSPKEIETKCDSLEMSEFVKKSVGVPAVSAPSALLSGSKTCLVLEKMKYQGVTVSIARENSL